MSRNRIDANTRIFSKLDNFCTAQEVNLKTLKKRRWIATKSSDRYVLDHLRLSEITPVGGKRHLAFGKLNETQYLISGGFHFSDPPAGFIEVETGPGHLTAILSDVPIPVTASPYEVKERIDLHDGETDGYKGHDHTEIEKLFPTIRLFSPDRELANPWNAFFKLCLEEQSLSIDSFENDLFRTLQSLADLDPNLLPYRVMCRSIFDGDPSSFFLALYRCMESLYSFSSAREMGRRFDLEIDWQEIAATIEEVTGWYPREESSLEALLRLASPADLEKFILAVGAEIPQGQPLSTKAAKELYGLRNAVVHYRPAHQARDLDQVDWEKICIPLVGLILDVWTCHAFVPLRLLT